MYCLCWYTVCGRNQEFQSLEKNLADYKSTTRSVRFGFIKVPAAAAAAAGWCENRYVGGSRFVYMRVVHDACSERAGSWIRRWRRRGDTSDCMQLCCARYAQQRRQPLQSSAMICISSWFTGCCFSGACIAIAGLCCWSASSCVWPVCGRSFGQSSGKWIELFVVCS